MKVFWFIAFYLISIPTHLTASPEPFAQRFIAEKVQAAQKDAGVKSQNQQLSKWLGSEAIKVPTCPQIVSTRCLVLNQLKQGMDTKSYETVRNSLDQLHEQNSLALEEPSLALVYAALLVNSKQFPRALSVLFPIISKEPSLTQPYEWIQNLYNHSDRSEGKVAIKNP